VVGCLKCKRGVIAHERATLPAVIVRESGRSSIPEKVVMESKSRGVLDHPLSRVMTATDSKRMASMPLVHSLAVTKWGGIRKSELRLLRSRSQ
jgi:hypothetical protein